MSTAGSRRTLSEATASAEAFRALFEGTFERWQVSGSIRRKKPDVGDAEHLVIPRIAPRAVNSGLFPETRNVNLLWERMDQLVEAGNLVKHLYGASGFRWGEKYRGCEFGGMLHEVWTANASNWGCKSIIRTGPADFSERVVTVFKQGGMYRQHEGDLVLVSTGETVPVPDEQTYLKLAGIPWIEPEDRR